MTALETAISLLGAATAGVDGGTATAAYGQPSAVESKGLITQTTQQARRHRGANGGDLDDVGGGGGFGGDDEILRNTLKLFDSTIVAIDSAISVKGTVNHRSAFHVPAAAGTRAGGPVSSATATNVNIPRNVSQVHNRRETTNNNSNNNNNNNRRTHKKQLHQQPQPPPQQQQQQQQTNWRNANNRYSAAQLADDLDKLVASCTFDKRQPTKVSLHERVRDDAPPTSVNRRSESPPVRRTLALPAESSIRRFRQRSKDRRRSSSSDSDTTQKRTRMRQRRSCRQRSASAGARCPPRDVRTRRDRGDGSSSDSSTLNSDDEKALKPSVRSFTTSTTASAVSVTAPVTTSSSTTPRNDVIIYAHHQSPAAVDVRSPPRLTPSLALQREDVSSVDKSRMHVSVLEISRPEATIIVPLPYGAASTASVVADLGTRISPTVISYEPLNEAIAQLHSAPTVVVTATADERENSNDEQTTTTSVTSSPSPAVVEVVVQSAPVDVVSGRVAPPTIVAAVADSLVPETVLTVKETQRIAVVISEPEIPEYVLTPVTSRDDQLNDTARGTDNLSSSNNGSDVVQSSIAAGDPVTSSAMTSLPTASLADASAISKAESSASAAVGTDFDQHKELAAELEKDESTGQVEKSVAVDRDDDDVTSAPKNDVATETPQTTSTGVDGEQGKSTEENPGSEKKVVPESAVRGSSIPKVSSESRLTRPEVDEDQRGIGPKPVGGSLSGTGIVRKHLIHLEKILHDDHGTPKDSKQRTARKAHTADLLSLGIRRHVSLSAVDRKHDKATTDDTSSSSCARSKAGDSAVSSAASVSLNCSTLVNTKTPSFPQVVLSPLST